MGSFSASGKDRIPAKIPEDYLLLSTILKENKQKERKAGNCGKALG